MNKKKTIVSLVLTIGLLGIGGVFALSANTTVSAAGNYQRMLSACVHIGEETEGKDANGIRFPVVVTDAVAEKITASKMYVLPADFWGSAVAPTSEQIIMHDETLATDTTNAWGNYAEDNTSYDDGYEETFVCVYNIPEDQYTTDFYVCSWIRLESGVEETTDVISRSMSDVVLSAVNAGDYTTDQLGKYLDKSSYKVEHYTRTITGAYTFLKTTTVDEGYVGLTPTLIPETIQGYTYNSTLTTQVNQFIVLENSDTTFACYYESNDYVFEKMSLNNSSEHAFLDVSEEGTWGSSFEEFRPNTWLVEDTHISGDQKYLTFKHEALPTDGYMLLSIYVVEKRHANRGFRGVYGVVGYNYYTWEMYDESYNRITSYAPDDMCGQWITIAVDLKNSNGVDVSLLCFSEYTPGAKVYIGEYTTITTEQYQQYFAQE